MSEVTPLPNPPPQGGRGQGTPWAPAGDDDLTWFRPPLSDALPARPRPLEYTLAVQAFIFGLSRALESLYFPMYEIRSRLVDGELYLASVPSAMAEADLEAQRRRMQDSAIRFSRDIRSSWERGIRREVEGYNERMAAYASASATDAEIADELPRLRRIRANQWFAPIRAVIAPAALLQQGLGETAPEEAKAVVEEVREIVGRRGTATLDAALTRAGERLTRAGSVDTPEGVYWLGYDEVREALASGRKLQSMVAERRAAAGRPGGSVGPNAIGPPLPTGAPSMYLVREILELVVG